MGSGQSELSNIASLDMLISIAVHTETAGPIPLFFAETSLILVKRTDPHGRLRVGDVLCNNTAVSSTCNRSST